MEFSDTAVVSLTIACCVPQFCFRGMCSGEQNVELLSLLHS